MMKLAGTSLLMLLFAFGYSQDGNDVYLFSLDRTSKGEYSLGDPKFISTFNPDGYSNQPSFTPSGDLLLSVRKNGDAQNDIWQFSFSSKKFKKLTATVDYEYSPVIHPHEENLTVLRKREGEKLDQQVCSIDLRSGELEVVTPEIYDIGYYTWLSPHELGLYRIDGSTSRLSYYDIKENKNRRITTSIGRTLASDKKGMLIYVHKFTDENWYIKKYDPSDSSIDIITRTVGKNEDFALAPDGTIFMGEESKLFTFDPDKGKEWRQIADLSVYGIKFISRMAISPDSKKIVLISSRESL